MVKFKKLLFVKFIALFLAFLMVQMDFSVYAQKSDFETHFERAKQAYIEGKYQETVNQLERILSDPGDDNKEFLGKAYLLLGAGYEMQGKITEARENYTLTKQFLEKPIIEGLDSSSLIEFQRIIMGKKVKPTKEIKKKIIEKPGEKKIKKKKFPVFLVVLGVAAVVALVVLIGGKKKKSEPPQSNRYTLTVSRGEGIEGSPSSGTYTYDQDSTVNYNYSLQSGYHTLVVTLDGNTVDSSGTITMNSNHTLSASSSAGDPNYDTNVLGMEWIDIPAGDFQMGDNFNEGIANERPVHTVYLDSYKISRYEVTFDQYDRFCDDTGRTKPDDNGWGRGNRPVINVNWHDSNAFCEWLSLKTGKNIHLPTEAQWEKAARGTDQRRYPWGNSSPNCMKANYRGCGGQTKAVGSHPSGISPYGVHDMAGNVWEWCWDLYSETYYSDSPRNNPTGPTGGISRVMRGGSWNNYDLSIRSAYRSYNYPCPTNSSFGFRPVQD